MRAGSARADRPRRAGGLAGSPLVRIDAAFVNRAQLRLGALAGLGHAQLAVSLAEQHSTLIQLITSAHTEPVK
jgi:hypothetical protein